jgi:hypothetical protein
MKKKNMQEKNGGFAFAWPFFIFVLSTDKLTWYGMHISISS